MRTIKFRGKASYNGEWLFGYLINICGNYHILGKDDIREDGHHVAQDSDRPTWVDLETIGQFTGFHDRNGKVIYEGDIIDVHIPCNSIGKEEHRTRVVVWNEKCARFEFQDKRGNCIADSVGAKYNVVYYEVVGNVFDNPELLEEEGDK